jgi:hypothetical protein
VLTDDVEREALAGVVSWTDYAAHARLVEYRCDWLPDRLSRPLLSRVLDNRRASSAPLSTDVAATDRDVSRWYFLSWLRAIAQARRTRRAPAVDVLEFIRTFGGSTNIESPKLYGFVQVFSSVEPLGVQFEPENILKPNKYFMAKRRDAINPMIGFDFSEGTNFLVESLSIVTNPPLHRGNFRHAPKPFSRKVVFKFANSVHECYQ